MPTRVPISTLNARTVDILNTIRANASAEYQALVPEISDAQSIPRVGEVICGYPALANQFINALLNRIALVNVRSMNFNNMYADLKKGVLGFGEIVEEVFVEIAKAREFSREKAADRELKRTMPDVKAAFHAINWAVEYPITIEEDELERAFLNENGVTDMIARIVGSLSQGNEVDEFLLTKYLLIKCVSSGKMYPVSVDPSDIKNSAVAFRGTAEKLAFPSNKFNSYGVTTTSKKSDLAIFMTADFVAQYDVGVLAAAFNMDKADFTGRLYVIDSFTEFDNERFDVIRANSGMIEEITESELSKMQYVQAILVDKEFFQIYDVTTKFTNTYVSAGDYWNYHLIVKKIVSFSPFSNAVVFVNSSATGLDLPGTISVSVTSKIVSDIATTFVLTPEFSNPILRGGNMLFEQGENETESGIAVHPYGAVIFPAGSNENITLTATVEGVTYTASTTISTATEEGASFSFAKS